MLVYKNQVMYARRLEVCAGLRFAHNIYSCNIGRYKYEWIMHAELERVLLCERFRQNW